MWQQEESVSIRDSIERFYKDVNLMTAVTVIVVGAEDLNASHVTAGSQMFCVIQKSGTYAASETDRVDAAVNPIWNADFTFEFSATTTELILICLFKTDTDGTQVFPIGTLKIPVAQLVTDGPADKHYPLAFYSDSDTSGSLHIVGGLADLVQAELESDSDFQSDGSSSDASRGHVRRRHRKPVDFIPGHGRGRWQDIDVNALGQRDRKHHRRRKAAGELKESGTGPTLDKLMMQRKEGSLNAALERLKMDPVKMKAFADYSSLMTKNRKLIASAKDEGRWTEDGTIKKELSAVTLRSIRFAIEETKEWIDKVKKL